MTLGLESLVGSLTILANPEVWLYIFAGAVFGTFLGAMPGFGVTLGYSLIVPFTFVLEPVNSVSLLLALSVGAQFGNSLPAILAGIPGTPSAILTVLDGHALYKRGQGDVALGASYLSSLTAQLISIPLFVALVIPLANLAYVFQAPELFGMYMLGMIAIISLTGKNMIKGLVAAGFGMVIGLVGLDPLTTRPRLTFGWSELRPGFSTVAVVIGILAVGEIFRAARQTFQWGGDADAKGIASIKLPRLSKMGGRGFFPPLFGGTVIGTLVGAIPGAGATPAALISYQQAKLWSKHPEEFGDGSISGIIANEAAQNASNSGELIPTLALGIPGSSSMLLLLSALQIHGFIPGPFLIRDAPEMLYATIAGLLGGTVVLLIIGMKMAGLMLRAVRIDRSVVLMTGLALVMLGVWSLRGKMLDVGVMLLFGVIGYFMYRFGYSPAAAALAVILSSGFERSLRLGLALSDNSPVAFVTRPTTAVLLAISLALLVLGFYKEHAQRRKAVAVTARRSTR